MQVATVNAVPLGAASRQPRLSAGIEGVLSLIASSTSLSPAEKKYFMQDLADIEKFAGSDPKLIMTLIKAIMALVASRKPGIYPADSLEDIKAEYLSIRWTLSTSSAVKTDSGDGFYA